MIRVMTKTQTEVLNWMADNRIGAFIVDGKWVFPEHIRKDARLAKKVYFDEVNPKAATGSARR